MSKLTVLKHPLIEHKMAIVRDKNTNTKDFREAISEIGMLITYEISRDFPTVSKTIETPLVETTANVLKNNIVIVPFLRAGIGMVEGIHMIIPQAKIGHIGLYRDQKTLKPVTYFKKLPDEIEKSTILLVDPMLATGGTVSAAITILKEAGAKDIRYVGVVGCPEGVELLKKEHPDVDVYLAALDEKLNEKSYIVPGLGDCGDRMFGTK